MEGFDTLMALIVIAHIFFIFYKLIDELLAAMRANCILVFTHHAQQPRGLHLVQLPHAVDQEYGTFDYFLHVLLLLQGLNKS